MYRVATVSRVETLLHAISERAAEQCLSAMTSENLSKCAIQNGSALFEFAFLQSHDGQWLTDGGPHLSLETQGSVQAVCPPPMPMLLCTLYTVQACRRVLGILNKCQAAQSVLRKTPRLASLLQDTSSEVIDEIIRPSVGSW